MAATMSRCLGSLTSPVRCTNGQRDDLTRFGGMRHGRADKARREDKRITPHWPLTAGIVCLACSTTFPGPTNSNRSCCMLAGLDNFCATKKWNGRISAHATLPDSSSQLIIHWSYRPAPLPLYSCSACAATSAGHIIDSRPRAAMEVIPPSPGLSGRVLAAWTGEALLDIYREGRPC